MNPEKVLAREAFNQPAGTYVSSEDQQNSELEILSRTLRELIRQDMATQKVQMRSVGGGPAGN